MVIVPRLRTETLRPLLPRNRCSMRSSELPRPFARPPLHDHFLPGEELDGVAALPVEVAEEALARAAEREVCHRGGYPDVNADITDLGFVAELSRTGTAGREQARLVAIGSGIYERDRTVDVRDVMHGEHGAEDLGAGDLALERQSLENRGRDEVAFGVRAVGVAPVGHSA